MARVPSVGRSACKCSSRRRPLPRRSARAAGVVRGAPLKAVVPAWRRRDRVELSQCGAGGLLKARATMRVSDTSGHGGDGGSGARRVGCGCCCWRSRHSRLTASTRAGDPVHRRGLGAGASAYILGITVRLYGYVTTIVGCAAFGSSPIVSPPLRLARFIVYSPRRLIFRIRSASAERRGRGPRPEFAGRSHPTAPRRAAACARVGRVSEATQVVIVDHPRFRAASAPRPSVRVPRKIQLHV